MIPSAADADQRTSHHRGNPRAHIQCGLLQIHAQRGHRLVPEHRQFEQREQSLHESLVLQRTGDRRIPHRYTISAQSFAEQPHGGIVVGDDRHVVPPNMPVKMRPLDAPDHIIQLLT